MRNSWKYENANNSENNIPLKEIYLNECFSEIEENEIVGEAKSTENRFNMQINGR